MSSEREKGLCPECGANTLYIEFRDSFLRAPGTPYGEE